MTGMKLWAVLTTAVVMAATVVADESPSPVYHAAIDASFDPERGEIDGAELLRWCNTTSAEVNEVQLHLYLNAFANNRVTFMDESGGQLRGLRMDAEGWGWIEVQSIEVVGGGAAPAPAVADWGLDRLDRGADDSWPELGSRRFDNGIDLTAHETFLQPDDGNLEDRSVVAYPLPAPLAPGRCVDLRINFRAHMPEVFARNGVDGDYVLGGQWFPKIGVLEDRGVRGRATPGWNTHQYHATSEFYSDFGDWEVSLKLPERYQGKIGATGQLVSETVEDGFVTARFAQNGVHDFAWTADPSFLVLEERFDPILDVPEAQRQRIASLLGVEASQLELSPVTIRLMLQPVHRKQARRYFDAAKAAIRGLGLRLGAYPYKTLTLVDPPRGAMGSGGMEYQTFITLGTHPLLSFPPLRGILGPEQVTVHEFGHNFFYGMIASNEFEEAWIDEGMTSFYEMVIMEDEYGSGLDVLGLRVTPFEHAHAAIAGGRFADKVVQPSWTYRSWSSYGLNSYSRAALTLRHLEGLLGPTTFHRAMRRFFQTWRFRHPSTADFESIMKEEAGRDIAWFLEQALHTTAALDYAVGSVESVKLKERRGFFWDESGRQLIEEGSKQSGEEGSDGKADGAMTEYRSTVVIERRGEFRHPVMVDLVFEDGERQRRHWDGQSRWVRWVETGPSRLVSAEVDPEHIMALDVNRLNNSRRIDPDPAPSLKILAHIVFWMQNLFAATAIVG
jgi:hypothetical protein